MGDPVWFKVDPNPVPAQGRAEITIRCRVRPRELPAISVNLGSMFLDFEEYTASPQDSPLRISSVSFSYDLSRAYVYVKRSSENVAPVKAILWDGEDVIDSLLPLQSGWQRGAVAGFILSFSEPLQRGDFHQITAITADGQMDTAQIKARDAFFPICMFGLPIYEETFLQDMARYHFNSVAWTELPAEKAIQFGLRTFSGEADSPAVYGAWLPDEPDAHDYGCKKIGPWLRLGAQGMHVAEKRREIQVANPVALQMLNIDATFKPVNWMCYAQLGDIIAHDPYYTANFPANKDPMCVYAHMKVLTDNCRPKPSLPLLFAMTHGPPHKQPGDPGYREESRFATPEEIELQNAYAVAAGAKGISYWWYRHHPTVASQPWMLRAMGRVNVRLRQIAQYVAKGIATDWARAYVPGQPKWHPIASEPVRVWCRTIWAPDAVVVFVCHNEYTSKPNPGGFSSEPIEDFPVRVRLPELWEDQVKLYEITDAGTSDPTTLAIKNGEVRFTIPSVKVSNWYLLKRLDPVEEKRP